MTCGTWSGCIECHEELCQQYILAVHASHEALEDIDALLYLQSHCLQLQQVL